MLPTVKALRDAMRLVVQKSRFFAQEQYGERFVSRLATLNARNIDEMIEAGSVLCGSPKTVIKQMKRIQGELGNGRFNLNMKIGNIPDRVVRRGMELFLDQVLPEAASL